MNIKHNTTSWVSRTNIKIQTVYELNSLEGQEGRNQVLQVMGRSVKFWGGKLELMIMTMMMMTTMMMMMMMVVEVVVAAMVTMITGRMMTTMMMMTMVGGGKQLPIHSLK